MNSDPDDITITCQSCPEWLTIQERNQSFQLVGVPKINDTGNFNMRLIASDGINQSEQSVSIYVKPPDPFSYYNMFPTLKNKWYFNSITDIAIDNRDNVNILDQSNNRVLQYNSIGQLLSVWGQSGDNDCEFNAPEAIAVDMQNNIYVLDSGNYRIQKLNSNGEYVTQWKGESITLWHDDSPSVRLLTVDIQGYLYISNGKEIK
ncbi:MAG: hypothetical protein OMM_13364, partial [Candidatus Magnetoglobus multicellularis str. Araruama]